jgi:hypothetical protein
MSILKDIHELSIEVKGFYISLITIFPFFFCSIYFFQPELIIKGQEYIAIAISFCLSIVYVSLFLLLNILIAYNSETTKNIILSGKEIFILCYVLSVLWFCIFFFLCLYFDYKFVCFLKILFFILLLLIIPILVKIIIIELFTKRRAKNKHK